MTASNPFGDMSALSSGAALPIGDAGPAGTADDDAWLFGAAGSGTVLDSSAQLMTRISSQLGNQLSLVQRDGTRRDARPALILVAHGSRDRRALTTMRRLAERVREQRPTLDVHLGHLEINSPLLPHTLASLDHGPAVLVPLLLGRGFHIKQDIPAMTAAASRLDTRVAPPLGPHPLLVEALYSRLTEAGWPTRLTAAERRRSGIVLAAAGSRDPDSARDTQQTAAQLADRLGVPVLPGYAAGAAPTVPAALRALTARGRHRVAVASYFTAPGRFSRQCAEAAPWIAAKPLGAHPAVVQLVLSRYDQALAMRHLAAPRQLTPA